MGMVIVAIMLLATMSKAGQCTNSSIAGECKPSKIYKEMTLKGGINAGTYKDIGGVSTMEQCQSKCCSFPACDLAFMLAGNCYLVGCKDQKQCAMQPAKESTFKPMISYVTRWNNEGVKHTVLPPAKENQYTCPTMKPINKVTLKGGLQAGDFADIGRVSSIGDCYNVCCQQEKCDLAFMLGQNCFTVVCKDKRLCVTTPAQPSIFNPQIAYVTKRGLVNVKKENIARPVDGSATTACPNTRIFENMTLKGGVNAGAYKDHGKVKDMLLCRRICCEMTECHLAFMLGTNCFSVKCTNVDSCRAQRAKPSQYSPKISYVRKVGTNQLLPNQAIPSTPPATNSTTATLTSTQQTPPQMQPATTSPSEIALDKLNQLNNAIQVQTTANTQNAVQPNHDIPAPSTTTDLSGLAALLQTSTSTASPIIATATTSTLASTTTASPSQDLLQALEQASLTTQPPPVQAKQDNGTASNIPICKLGKLRTDATLKGGRNSGEFIEQKGTNNMNECAQKCCMDSEKKCNLAFMLGNACYSVRCSKAELCQTIKAPPTKFNPIIQYVRGLDDIQDSGNTKNAVPVQPSTTPTTTSPITTDTTTEATTETTTIGTCRSQPIVHGKSIRGGRKAGKFKIFRAIKDIDTCINKCCSLKKDCDVAYMEDNNCYSIQCFKKSACTAIPLRDTDVEPVFAYMDTFLDKVDEEEAEGEISTELEQSDISACGNVDIKKNKTLKGGTRAGKFHPLGKKTMESCISNCCDRPNCDVAYLLNGHCYAVECTDSKLCQSTGEPAKAGDNVQLAYMNKASSGDKQRDYVAIYVIVASVVISCVAGVFIWMVYAYKKRHRVKEPRHKKLLNADVEEEEETIDNIMHKKPFSRTRHKQRRY